MKYLSTRDVGDGDGQGGQPREYTLEEALCAGYAPDGGLFIPKSLPSISRETLKDVWSKYQTFAELAFALLKLFVSEEEIPAKVLWQIIEASYGGGSGSDNDKGSGDGSNERVDEEKVIVRPLTKKTNDSDGDNGNSHDVYVSELFHGPTFCFKDWGMRPVIGMLSYFAQRKQQPMTLLVSTTGDTGPAAVQAVQDLPSFSDDDDNTSSTNDKKQWLSLLVHYPKGQISDFQRKQLTTATSPNIQIVAFEGGGDDMDLPLKNIMTKTKKATGANDKNNNNNNNKAGEKDRILCGINSYNIGRPLMQMVHFIWTYLRVVEDLGIEPGDPDFVLDLIIPTGAMGNMTGGYMAKQMGIPFGTFCAAVNINDITHSVFSTGIITKDTTQEMKVTLSEAINIQLPYNLERILYYVTKRNHSIINDWYMTLEGKKTTEQESDEATSSATKTKVELTKVWYDELQKGFTSYRVTDDALCTTIRNIKKEYDYYADPHTGVALCAAYGLGYLKKEEEEEAAVGTSKGKQNNDGNDDDVNEQIPEKSSVQQQQQEQQQEHHRHAIAVMATASPCKFQHAMTVALGVDGWKEYEKEEFPKEAYRIMSLPERELVIYQRKPGTTLEETQMEWEDQCRTLIEKF